jgi:CTP synthase (UTP-ammonia lyase)
MPIRIAVVGDEQDHPSHHELNALRAQLAPEVEATWVATDGDAVRDLSGFDGVWLVPGSPYADDAAAYEAIRWARESGTPFLGTCGGLQYGVIEYCRNALGDAAASHAESDGASDDNVVVPLACSLLGEEREVRPVPGTRFAGLVDDTPFIGMHYCGFAPSEAAIERVVDGGFVIGATADDAGAEVLELPSHPFFVLSLFQPHVGALAGAPVHPLLREFVRVAGAHRTAAR